MFDDTDFSIDSQWLLLLYFQSVHIDKLSSKENDDNCNYIGYNNNGNDSYDIDDSVMIMIMKAYY